MTDQQTQHGLPSSRHRRAIVLSLMLAALAYLAVVIYTGYEQALSAFSRMGYVGWLLLFAGSLSNYILRYLRWQYYLRSAGWRLDHTLHFLYYLSAFSLTTTPGKAGETIRSVLLRPHGVPYHTSLACFFTERFLDLVVVALLALLIVLNFTGYTGFVVVFTGVLVLLLPFIRSQYLLELLQSWQHRFKESRLGWLLGHIANLLQNARGFLASKLLYMGLITGLVSWSIQGFAFFFILHSLGFETSIAIAMGIYALSLLAGAASFIPGGIGSTELVMGLLLSASGADNAIAITAPLISRLSTLWFAVAVGFIATGILSLLRNQRDENLQDRNNHQRDNIDNFD